MEPAHYHELDRPWRRWASAIIIGVLVFSLAFGFLILPVVQGRASGLDAFTAICRAVGLLPGSPAVPQPTTEAAAQPATRVAWSTDLLRVLARPTPAGAEVAQACVGCHGERGIAADPQNPNLAGQSAVAIYKQLHDYKSGSRVHDAMTAIAQGLEDRQIEEVAAHFASSTRRDLDPTTAEVVDEDIVRLVERGDPARGLPLVPRLQCRRTHRDPDAVAPEPGVPGAAAESLPERRPAQRHLYPDAEHRVEAQRPGDRQARQFLCDDPQLLTVLSPAS